MAETLPDTKSPHIRHNGDAFFQAPRRVSNHFDIADELIDRIRRLEEDETPASVVAHRIFDIALGSFREEQASTGCRKTAEACRACIGATFHSFGRAEADVSPRRFEMTINIGCDVAMVSQVQVPEATSAPVSLMRQKKGEGRVPYDGVRVFDSGCYEQMGAMATRVVELFEEEISAREVSTSTPQE